MFSSLTILYGSETGNCQDLAKIISWKVSQRCQNASLSNFILKLHSCDEFDIRQLPNESLILFVCSTTGVGEEPQNMKKFWRFLLRRDLPENALASLSFAVIGLGDSSYLKYNFVAKKLFKRLKNLGANALLELALGDDQHELGPYVKIDPWLKEFYNLIVPDEGIVESECPIPNSITVTDVQPPELQDDTQHNEEGDYSGPFDCLHPYSATVADNTRLTTEDHFQDTRLISLEINPQIYHYNLGDVCVVYPENTDTNVDKFLQLFGDENKDYSGERFISLTENSSSWLCPESYYRHAMRRAKIKVRDLVKQYMELTSVPKRSFFELLYRFSKDELERSKLKQFAEGSDLDELYDYVNRPKRTILEVLTDFPHTTPFIPFAYLFDLIPSILPRPYSIASAPSVIPNRIQILVAVVEYQTRIREPRRGLCSNWLSTLVKEDSVRIFLRRSNFIPPDHGRPLVMVSAGTGVAPFRAFIQDRFPLADNDRCPLSGETILFFGCRYRDKDFYFSNEFQAHNNRLILFTAFSRERPNESKDYVQNRLLEEGLLIERILLKDNGIIWIAGRSQQYPTLVRDAILQSLVRAGLPNPETMLTNLETKKRIVFECW